jgi:hypothetical protein
MLETHFLQAIQQNVYIPTQSTLDDITSSYPIQNQPNDDGQIYHTLKNVKYPSNKKLTMLANRNNTIAIVITP